VPGQPGLAGQPVLRPGDHADAAVTERGQVSGHAAGPGEVRGGDGGDVARHGGTRVDHDEREPAGAQGGELLAGLGRQDHDGAADAGPRGQRGQHCLLLGGLPGVEHQALAVQFQGLGDGGDDQPEVVGQQVWTAQVDRSRRTAPGAACLRAQLLGGAPH
jgi:hypothetical protein